MTFNFDTSTNVPTVQVSSTGPTPDNNVEWDGLRHESRDTLYRTPGGAVPAGTNVTLRFRTFHDDVTSVSVRFFSVDRAGQEIVPMSLAAGDVSCYQPELDPQTCDFWQVTLPNDVVADPDVLWYRFIVSDGTDTDYYADNTAALDGGLGTPYEDAVDRSWALSIHEPSFTAPAWARDAVIYQIFPDRFRNGRANDDPTSGDVRYAEPVIKLSWATKPEGYCRNYADAGASCPWRFANPGTGSTEQPRGRDYMGGDLRGVDQQLDYLENLGVTAIYFNPVFDAGSNHSYDTQDYTRIDPYFGTQKDWDNLVKHADSRGIRIILDGVFNHLSSDSPFFDRYHHDPTAGACESASSPWRGWFTFHDVAAGTGNCVSSAGVANAATYDGWFGFDSIPVLTKSDADVQAYFLTAPDSIARLWLDRGASGWRMDVSGDPSFPAGYWESFRSVVKGTDPDALTISETWQKDSTLLRMVLGDRLDTTMNYRFRDAVIGYLTPGAFDSKGFPDSGRIISPSELANRLAAIREDYADAAYYSLMNLLDSHDTERLLWTLTPGAETTADKESNGANLAEGKAKVRLASLLQFALPGAPTVFYGDEVGLTGDDDPDDRRTYPWADLGGSPDLSLRTHYETLAATRDDIEALTDGDFRVLLADDAAGVVAFGRRTGAQAAIVTENRSASPATVEIPLAGYVPDGIVFAERLEVNGTSSGSYVVTGGAIEVTLPPRGGLLLATGSVALTPPPAPAGLTAVAGSGQVDLDWADVAGAAGYHVYRSPLTGGGFVRLTGAPISSSEFVDPAVVNGRTYFYVVTALDATGNESGWSNEASALPHLSIGWANLQWPPTMSHTISTTDRTDSAYGQVWIDGATNQPGPTPGLRAQLGFGPDRSDPTGSDWTWVEASFNVDVGNNDEFVASLLPEAVGAFDYVYRYSTTGGQEWLYADLNGPIPGGSLPPNPGVLTVAPSGDTTAPAVPTGLTVVNASPAGIELAWDAIAGDPSLHGYEVRRSGASGGPYTTIALVTGTTYADLAVAQDATYYYVVRSVDTSFNRSADSVEVPGTAELRTVSVVFTVTVPASTEATGASVFIAGTLNRLDGGLPEWTPGGVVLTRTDGTHWTITLTGDESTQIEYKYTLGDWEHVEKDGSCGEVANRQLTLSYGATGVQAVNDTVENWRNVAPCGN